MLLVLCVDLDDDLGRKTDVSTPVVGRDAVRDAAVSLATADAEDSDLNVLFEGVNIYDRIDPNETVAVAAITGTEGSDVAANRAVGEELDAVLDGLSTDGDARALLVTDGAQDESVVPVVRSRVQIDGVRRVVVRQAQDLESMYYTIKQVIADPETRGTVLIPLGIVLLIYPLSVLANALNFPGDVFGVASGLFGLYLIARGLGLEQRLDEAVDQLQSALYAGRVTLITSLVAGLLGIVGVVIGVNELAPPPTELDVFVVGRRLAAVVNAAVVWIAAAGIVSSSGRVVDGYLRGTFEWRHLNAPFYIVAIAGAIHAASGWITGSATQNYLFVMVTAGLMLGLASTFAFAVADARSREEAS
ncbi:DUF373 family protein [Halococcoides cellulosivorans]|uniref:DUF373 family protein n=1 Tax=Halococcoides cellulosivorans TaxID=1679096 RepID=A0A2R4X1T4_9EURY|nr:DUF373 family protein [Halococcoides cellulosivorans]AWB27759.1 hypothetical protein HARCEL1_08570 [Halococcoides cellulosivorans]